MALPPQLLEHGDGVGKARLEGVDRVDQQKAIVRVQVGIGPEGLELACRFGYEHLDQRMGMGAARDEAQPVRGGEVGGSRRSADERSPGGRIGRGSGRPPHPELQDCGASRRFHRPRGLGGNQRGVIEPVQQRGLQELGHGQRRLHGHDRRLGMHHPALRNRPHRERREPVRSGQPFDEWLAEEALAGAGSRGAQGVRLRGSEPGVLHPVDQRPETGGDAVSGLVVAVVGVGTEVVVELGGPVGQAMAVVELSHGQLVMIGGQDALGQHAVTLPEQVP